MPDVGSIVPRSSEMGSGSGLGAFPKVSMDADHGMGIHDRVSIPPGVSDTGWVIERSQDDVQDSAFETAHGISHGMEMGACDDSQPLHAGHPHMHANAADVQAWSRNQGSGNSDGKEPAAQDRAGGLWRALQHTGLTISCILEHLMPHILVDFAMACRSKRADQDL